MAGRQPPKLQPKPVILPPDLDDDEEHAVGGIPDDDGWVYLKRQRSQETKRAKKVKPTKRPR